MAPKCRLIAGDRTGLVNRVALNLGGILYGLSSATAPACRRGGARLEMEGGKGQRATLQTRMLWVDRAAIVVPTRCRRELFLYRQRCFRNSPGHRSALRPKRVTLRATQGFAATGVRELIYQEVGPNEKIKRGQIKLTESGRERRAGKQGVSRRRAKRSARFRLLSTSTHLLLQGGCCASDMHITNAIRSSDLRTVGSTS